MAALLLLQNKHISDQIIRARRRMEEHCDGGGMSLIALHSSAQTRSAGLLPQHSRHAMTKTSSVLTTHVAVPLAVVVVMSFG